MDSLGQVNFTESDNSCKDIFEVLAHPIVFRALDEVIFNGALKGINTRDARIVFLKDEKNLKKIYNFLNYYHNEDGLGVAIRSKENIEKLTKKIEDLGKSYEDSLSRAQVWDKEKNKLSVAICALLLNYYEHSWDVEDIVARVNNQFIYILGNITNNGCKWDLRWGIAFSQYNDVINSVIAERLENGDLVWCNWVGFLINTSFVWNVSRDYLIHNDSRRKVQLWDFQEINEVWELIILGDKKYLKISVITSDEKHWFICIDAKNWKLFEIDWVSLFSNIKVNFLNVNGLILFFDKNWYYYILMYNGKIKKVVSLDQVKCTENYSIYRKPDQIIAFMEADQN